MSSTSVNKNNSSNCINSHKEAPKTLGIRHDTWIKLTNEASNRKKPFKFIHCRAGKVLAGILLTGVFILLLIGYVEDSYNGTGSSYTKIKRYTDFFKRLQTPNPLDNVILRSKLCHVNYTDGRIHLQNGSNLKMIYYVTPTYPRAEQVPELTRLAHTLMHVPSIHWVVADDQNRCSQQVLKILRKSRLPYTHLSSPKPQYKIKGIQPRGVSNRRAAIKWLQSNVKEGILYMGDDDNTVDLELFDEIRKTKKVSMFPVGLVGTYGVSSPIVKNGKVVKFFDSWQGHRKFAVDMAGFAVNIQFLNPNVTMPFKAGDEENKFLTSLGLKLEDIEPLANNCSRVLVWHTKTERHKVYKFSVDIKKRSPELNSFAQLLRQSSSMGLSYWVPNKTCDLDFFVSQLPSICESC